MNLLLFDMDGTLAESGQRISPAMHATLQSIRQNGYQIGIVGGGRHDKILWQLDGCTVDHIFSESGSVYYTDHCVYTNNLRTHPQYANINQLIKLALRFLSSVEYTLTGHFIDLRNGLVYISLIGMDATQEERAKFIVQDATYGHRAQLLQQLQAWVKGQGLTNQIAIAEGGSVGIAIFPTEWDKVQVLEHIPSAEEIHYFGDKYLPNGNDYKLLHHDRVIGHPVDTVEMCLDQLQGFVFQNSEEPI